MNFNSLKGRVKEAQLDSLTRIMTDLAQRQRGNLSYPRSSPAFRPDLMVECLLQPGVFRFENKVWLLVRVAERPVQTSGQISFPVIRNGELKSFPSRTSPA